MSLSFYVVYGKIPFEILKSDVIAGRIKGAKYLTNGKHLTSKKAFGIKYDTDGIIWAEPYKTGDTMFVEYAGSNGNAIVLYNVFKEMQKRYKCEIMDELAISELGGLKQAKEYVEEYDQPRIKEPVKMHNNKKKLSKPIKFNAIKPVSAFDILRR